MTMWRSADYRSWAKRYVCPVCGAESTDPAHVGGIAPKGASIKPADWVVVGMCRVCHLRLDGVGPALTQGQRERVLKQLVVSLGEFVESLIESDPKRAPKKQNWAPSDACPICKAPSGHRPSCPLRNG